MLNLPKRDRIVDAALACFNRFGVGKTTMDDVAEAAKVGRMTLYREFPSRTELMEAVAMRRIRGIASRLIPILRSCETFEESLVTGCIKSAEFAASDSVISDVVAHSGDISVERFLVSPNSPMNSIMLDVWGEVFDRARKRGELSADFENADLGAWLRAVQVVLMLRDDLSTAGKAKLLKRYVVPALISRRAPSARGRTPLSGSKGR